MAKPLVLRFDVDDQGSIKIGAINANLQALQENLDKTKGGSSAWSAAWARVTSVLDRVKSTVFSLNGALAALGVSLTIRSFMGTAIMIENLQKRMELMTGSTAEGNKMFQMAAQYAKEVTFQYLEVAQAAVFLKSTLNGSTEATEQWLRIAGDISARVGPEMISLQDSAGQIVRMLSAGAAAADMFREKGVLAMLGFKAGVQYTTEETKKMLLDAWNDPEKRIKGAAQGLSTTFSGIKSMIEDIWVAFQGKIMNSGAFQSIKTIFDDIRSSADQWLNENEERIEGWGKSAGEAIKWVAGMVKTLIENLGLLRDILVVIVAIKFALWLVETAGALGTLATAAKAAWTALAGIGAAGWAVGAALALVTGGWYAYKKAMDSANAGTVAETKALEALNNKYREQADAIRAAQGDKAAAGTGMKAPERSDMQKILIDLQTYKQAAFDAKQAWQDADQKRQAILSNEMNYLTATNNLTDANIAKVKERSSRLSGEAEAAKKLQAANKDVNDIQTVMFGKIKANAEAFVEMGKKGVAAFFGIGQAAKEIKLTEADDLLKSLKDQNREMQLKLQGREADIPGWKARQQALKEMNELTAKGDTEGAARVNSLISLIDEESQKLKEATASLEAKTEAEKKAKEAAQAHAEVMKKYYSEIPALPTMREQNEKFGIESTKDIKDQIAALQEHRRQLYDDSYAAGQVDDAINGLNDRLLFGSGLQKQYADANIESTLSLRRQAEMFEKLSVAARKAGDATESAWAADKAREIRQSLSDMATGLDRVQAAGLKHSVLMQREIDQFVKLYPLVKNDAAALADFNKRLHELQYQALSPGDFWGGMKSGFNDLIDNTVTAAQMGHDTILGLASAMQSGIVGAMEAAKAAEGDWMDKSKAGIQAWAGNMAKAIESIVNQMIAALIIKSMLSGISYAFPSFFKDGGSTTGGGYGLGTGGQIQGWWEEGMSSSRSTAGTVPTVPMAQRSASGPKTIFQVVNNSNGVRVEQEEEEGPDGERILRAVIHDEVITKGMNGGPLSRVLESTYGIRRGGSKR